MNPQSSQRSGMVDSNSGMPQLSSNTMMMAPSTNNLHQVSTILF